VPRRCSDQPDAGSDLHREGSDGHNQERPQGPISHLVIWSSGHLVIADHVRLLK
jgi:hypothetical protein